VKAGLLKHWRLLAGDTAPVAVELAGVDAARSAVNVLYVGSGINQDFMVRLVIDDAREQRRRPLASYWRGARAVAEALTGKAPGARPQVVLTDLPPLWGRLTPRAAQYRFPAWIRQELELPEGNDRWLLPRAVEREAARLARRHGYTVDFVSDVGTLRRFYREMYRPYVIARFGAASIVVAEDEFSRKAERCELARLHGHGNWTAGVLLERSRDAVRFGWFGASGVSPPPGASDVLDVACIRRARAAGVRRVQLGHSRPSLVDGVVRYKAKLGARVFAVRYPQAVLAITVHGSQQAMLERLNARQLIAIHGGRPSVLEAQ
jgi:hypothetical protein